MSQQANPLDFQEHIARIERMQEETRNFAAETRKIGRDYQLSAWQLSITGMAAGAALFGAGAAFLKLISG